MVIVPDVFSDGRGFFLDSSTFRMALASICIASDFAKSSKCTNFQEPARSTPNYLDRIGLKTEHDPFRIC
jgi:hypothetical protein